MDSHRWILFTDLDGTLLDKETYEQHTLSLSSMEEDLPYLTDGAVLQKYFGNRPTLILGPGEPEIAHTTDEFCYTDKLMEAVRIYKEIIKKWKG